jgi:hypothetical protein
MPRSTPRIPKYRLDKASGQSAVVLDGQWVYLGAYDSLESRKKCDRLVAEWLTLQRYFLGH